MFDEVKQMLNRISSDAKDTLPLMMLLHQLFFLFFVVFLFTELAVDLVMLTVFNKDEF